MRRTTGYNLSDHKGNDVIIKELHIPYITEFMEQHRTGRNTLTE
jgi:hypothetical protein